MTNCATSQEIITTCVLHKHAANKPNRQPLRHPEASAMELCQVLRPDQRFNGMIRHPVPKKHQETPAVAAARFDDNVISAHTGLNANEALFTLMVLKIV